MWDFVHEEYFNQNKKQGDASFSISYTESQWETYVRVVSCDVVVFLKSFSWGDHFKGESFVTFSWKTQREENSQVELMVKQGKILWLN